MWIRLKIELKKKTHDLTRPGQRPVEFPLLGFLKRLLRAYHPALSNSCRDEALAHYAAMETPSCGFGPTFATGPTFAMGPNRATGPNTQILT